MAKVGLFYGTDTGNTRKVAKMIKKSFEDDAVEIYNVAKATADDVAQYESLIFGMPTLGDGELENSFKAFMDNHLANVDLSGKTVALYGLGDQDGYGHEFLDGMKFIYDSVKEKGATVVGEWPTDGYDFTKSKAISEEDEDKFICLAIDQDNQSDMTKERVAEWLDQIKGDLGL